MRTLYFYITLMTLIFCSFQEVKMSKSAQKKMDKAIAAVWDTEVELKVLDLASFQIFKKEFTGVERVQVISEVSGKPLGYAVFTQAKGRYDMFDLLILYDKELNIQVTQVLAYREDWGGEISSNRWLKQFVGKSDADKIQLTHDIQGISGATISCQSATLEIKRITSLVNRLKKEGAFNI